MKLGILQIDPDLAIFQKSAVGILYGYSTFSITSFGVIDAWYSEFLIIGLLYYYAQDYQDFLYLQYSGLFSEAYQICSTTGILKIYTAESAEDDYYSVDLRALPLVLHILIGINSTLVPFVLISPLVEIARTQFFVRWMDCNTPLPEYVLSCVFRFFDRIFRFSSRIRFVL